MIWKLLDVRFPQKEQVDELGEIMGEVFALKVREGESMKMWAARSQEVFERCSRKTGVQFPDQARGWLMLHRAGLSEELTAGGIAMSGGDLKREAVSAALRSCYPDYVAKKRSVAAVEEVFPVEAHDESPPLEEDFADVQGLLEDHHGAAVSDHEEFAKKMWLRSLRHRGKRNVKSFLVSRRAASLDVQRTSGDRSELKSRR